MDVRQSVHSEHAKTLDTTELRKKFLIEKIFTPNQYTMTYSHIDRIVVGGIMPVDGEITFDDGIGKQFGVNYFLERRELGLINIGGPPTSLSTAQATGLAMKKRSMSEKAPRP